MVRAMHYMMAAGIAAGGVVMPLVVQAADTDDGSTLLRLNAEARRMVPEDRLKVTLAYEETAKTAAEAQRLVNAKMAAAAKLYSGASDMKVTTGNYNVWKRYDNVDPKATAAEREKAAVWQATQQLVLDGGSKDSVMALTGKLQEQGFNVQSMNFYLSREASDALTDTLAVEALGTVKQRAETMAKALGMKHIRYATLDIGGSTPPVVPMPMMRAVAMKAESADYAAPTAQAGEAEVVVNVNAEVKLSD